MPGQYGSGYREPGVHERTEAQERSIFWDPGNRRDQSLAQIGTIDSTCTDPTNTADSIYNLREGLILGKITASGNYKQYSPTAVDGTQFPEVVLLAPVPMRDINGTVRARQAPVAMGGYVIAAMLPNLDSRVRGYFFGRFYFDDDHFGNRNPFPGCVDKATDYTLTAEDMRRGIIFTNRGCGANEVNFFLPAPFPGGYTKIFGAENHGYSVVAQGAGQLVGPGVAEGESISIEGGDVAGTSITVFANAQGDRWLCEVNEFTAGVIDSESV